MPKARGHKCRPSRVSNTVWPLCEQRVDVWKLSTDCSTSSNVKQRLHECHLLFVSLSMDSDRFVVLSARLDTVFCTIRVSNVSSR